MAEVTIMVMQVDDLGCHRCFMKMKKLFFKFPEIRDQVFFEKEDIVMIKVVCCSPERIRQKLICKGGKTIKQISLQISEKKPMEAEKPKIKPADPSNPEKTMEKPPLPAPAPAKEPAPAPGPGPGPATSPEPAPATEPEPAPAPATAPAPWYRPSYEGHRGRPRHPVYGVQRYIYINVRFDSDNDSD